LLHISSIIACSWPLSYIGAAPPPPPPEATTTTQATTAAPIKALKPTNQRKPSDEPVKSKPTRPSQLPKQRAKVVEKPKALNGKITTKSWYKPFPSTTCLALNQTFTLMITLLQRRSDLYIPGLPAVGVHLGNRRWQDWIPFGKQ
jgi:hypothetical protein